MKIVTFKIFYWDGNVEIILTNQAKIGQFMAGCKDGFHSEDLSFKKRAVERTGCGE